MPFVLQVFRSHYKLSVSLYKRASAGLCIYIQQYSVHLCFALGESVALRVVGQEAVDYDILLHSEYGILRIIVSDPQKAYKILKENNVSANLTDVLAIVTSSCAGSFANTLSYFTKAGISIEYMYCFSIREKAILILRTNNRESAREVIRRQNLEYICESDLIKL